MTTLRLHTRIDTDIQARTLVECRARERRQRTCLATKRLTNGWRAAILIVMSVLTTASAGALTLTGAQVAQYAYNAGFRDLGQDRGLVTAIAIARAESSFKTD